MKLAEQEKLYWTKHSREKMQYYRISQNRIKRVLRSPDRKEIGIAPKTIALMQQSGTKRHPTEIWLMYQIEKIHPVKPSANGGRAARRQMFNRVKIISAWRYPGISPKGKPPPIPEDIIFELNEQGLTN